MKSFFVNDRPIEPRLLVRHDDGDWGGYSYAWRDDRSDATLLDEGLFKVVDGMLWQYPSRQACTTCHTEGGGRTLGLSVEQLNRAFDFQGHLPENQLAAMTRMGVLSRALDAPEALPRFPEEGDDDAPAADWARAYLQVNCAHCHVAGGTGVGGLDLSASARLPDLGCDRVPTYTLDIDSARVVAPGRPERSVLLARVANMDNWTRMPPIAAFRMNERAVERLQTWIEGLSSCEP